MGMEPPQLPTQAGCRVPCGRGGGSLDSKQSWGCAVSSRAGCCPALDVLLLNIVPGTGEAL